MSPTHTQDPPLSPPPPALAAHLEWSSVALKVIWPPGESRCTPRTFQLGEQSDGRTPVERRQNWTSRSVCSVGATQAWYRSEQDETEEVRVTATWSQQPLYKFIYFFLIHFILANVLLRLHRRNPGTHKGTFFKNKGNLLRTVQEPEQHFKRRGNLLRDPKPFSNIYQHLEPIQELRNPFRHLGTFTATLKPGKEPRNLQVLWNLPEYITFSGTQHFEEPRILFGYSGTFSGTTMFFSITGNVLFWFLLLIIILPFPKAAPFAKLMNSVPASESRETLRLREEKEPSVTLEFFHPCWCSQSLTMLGTEEARDLGMSQS